MHAGWCSDDVWLRKYMRCYRRAMMSSDPRLCRTGQRRARKRLPSSPTCPSLACLLPPHGERSSGTADRSIIRGSYWSATEHDDINITGADIRSAVVVFGDPSVYLGELVFQILALLVTAATTSVCDVASNDTEIVMCHQDSTSG